MHESNHRIVGEPLHYRWVIEQGLQTNRSYSDHNKCPLIRYIGSWRAACTYSQVNDVSKTAKPYLVAFHKFEVYAY